MHLTTFTKWAAVVSVLTDPIAALPNHESKTSIVPTTTGANAGPFSYTQVTSNRYATPVRSPVQYKSAFAPPYSKAKSLLPSGIVYTTYSLNPSATSDGKYGQSAYAALWANYAYSDTVPFTTTMLPTPVASAELVFPPALPFETSAASMKFGNDFIWGVAGSAWQIEGALQQEGRGPGGLDIFGNLKIPALSHTNDSVVADMNYYLYKQDIARLAAMGVPYYSFSISWSRIVPFGNANTPVNQQGLDHYDDVINSCLKYGIKPIVTLVHADTPPSVDYDNATSSMDDYMYYAKQVMTRYADRVPIWVTFNEINTGINLQYDTYEANTNILLIHSAIYKWYKQTLKGTGKITVKFANNLAVPRDLTNSEDVAAALRYQEFILGVWGNPLFLGKQYPSSVLNTAVNLTALTSDQLKAINGSIDFWAFDPYVSQLVSAPSNGLESCIHNSSHSLFPYCVNVTQNGIQENGWQFGQKSNDYAYIAPQYVRQQLGYVWKTFHPIGGIMITEFGFNPFKDAEKTLPEQRYDLERTLYFQAFLTETLKAIYLDGVKVIGALAWSFIDNNEFGSFENQYGLQTVNRTSGKFERSYKRSFFDLVDFFHNHIG
ncbi:glycoside hydrolase family 1 protein [Aureobasidium subglaciale EXF-2481]|uniref:Glycoside hydrolase family 1 protein n=1 Tax=Aureobasidium subglaciale (strain EXF-2481) TaxID=1043005 RepID=A0A074Y887_AURSE|nr:glycoside hydrolase family 1 protein [Aureobasidium subglaciale EXF-2481]KAI5195382.1 beta-glucosidase [Aureobasidium subglaciale]KAI5214415.1 beta-glucosidase [Aureobasidium subglaciale]KAI5217013.1 beta-glucosidase [Aureobasidium subglaciale]KAI5254736.1 beta-glucosidase [Aureobasidium subglaciale]KEQ90432.1 glycoside hydrolase family 1 protein [Aureobasidium subglaciale EXF-2481]